MEIKANHFYTAFFLGVLFISLYGAYLVLEPFVHIIIIGAVLAALFHPLHAIIVRKLGGKKNLSAFLTSAIVVLVIIVPLLFVASALLTQGAQTVNATQEWLLTADLKDLTSNETLAPMIAWLESHIPSLDIDKIDIQGDLLALSKSVGQYLLDAGTSIIGNAVMAGVNFCILAFVLFFLIRDGDTLLARIKYLSPLREEQENRIIAQFQEVSRSVIMGCFLIAALQGVVGGIGLAIAGVPALFWGTMMAFCSLIPVVGTALIWAPAALFLMFTGQVGWGLFLAFWGVAVVSMIDTVFRPLFLGGRSKMSMITVFLAIIGGIKYFGGLGILYGPLLISFAMIMLNIYSEVYADVLSEDKRKEAPAQE